MHGLKSIFLIIDGKNVKLIYDARLRVYDRVALVNREGGKAIIYFDVTKWNGRHY
jgi:hypothetical protein